MAVMGASGSGKTSLLNVLGQRLGLSIGSTMSGEVRCNDRKMASSDFGKFGAFVQQDDVLLETFSPVESFRFAAKLRTTLSNRKIEAKIGELIARLGLKGCANTHIGGALSKGLSGGERKRTSIGYELITDPNLLLCDEPTSGLDSSTAHRIVQMLKKEAQEQNLTIICTIH
jgi:ABC-type multidrug transport system ATPase subunit